MFGWFRDGAASAARTGSPIVANIAALKHFEDGIALCRDTTGYDMIVEASIASLG
jgi:hypothetical protein